MTDLTRLDELHAKATPGEWAAGGFLNTNTGEHWLSVGAKHYEPGTKPERLICFVSEKKRIDEQDWPNAEFIAECHNSYPSLSSELRAARERIAELEMQVAVAKRALKPFADVPPHGVFGGPLTCYRAIYEDASEPDRRIIGHEARDAACAAIASMKEGQP